jgi:hypothetical protein
MTGTGLESCTKQASPLSRITSGPILGLVPVDNLCFDISGSCWCVSIVSRLGRVLTANVKKMVGMHRLIPASIYPYTLSSGWW